MKKIGDTSAYSGQQIAIPGLKYVRNYIAKNQERDLLYLIESQPWLTDLRRRVQHYGYKYDYKSRTVSPDMYLGPLPEWLETICRRLHQEGLMPKVADQVIVNEYEPGQGISPHVDCKTCFDATIASLSLGSSCFMDFVNVKDGKKISLCLEARSLIVLSGEARYEWKHSIPQRKSDVVNEQTIQRGRRVSLTFRNVLIKAE